jgi:hypothetical protein
MFRFVGILALSCLASGPAFAAVQKIDRSIGKQPVYQSKSPKYGMLVFGPSGKDRVWIVHDGNTLYVDRNGNGDLTDPREKVPAERSRGNATEDGYSFNVGDVTVGGRTHEALQINFIPLERYGDDPLLGKRPDVKAAVSKNPRSMVVVLTIDAELQGVKGGGLGGRLSYKAGPFDLTGVLQFADTPRAAPAVHLGGPLQISFYSERPTLRIGRQEEQYLVVGTPGSGPGTFAMLGYEGTIPKTATAFADIAFPAGKRAPPIKERFVFKERC